jgi:CBS domain-containing protein
MKVKETIALDPQRIGPDASLIEATQQTKALNVGILPLGENDRLTRTAANGDITTDELTPHLAPKNPQAPHSQYISPDASLIEAAQKMKALNVGILPVCENDHLAGTVTDRDITVRGLAARLDPENTKVRQVMTLGVVYCSDNQTVEEIAQTRNQKRVRSLWVLNQSKQGDVAVRARQETLAGALDDLMLELIAIILVLLWVLGLTSSYTMRGFIHVLPALAMTTILVRLIRSRPSRLS